jgi:hypothetical protein
MASPVVTPSITVSKPEQPDWVIVAFIVGAVILGLAGLILGGSVDPSVRHDCFNLATVLGSAAAGGYASRKSASSQH